MRQPIVCVVDDDPSVLCSLGRLLRSLKLGSATYASAEELLSDPARRDAACFLLDVHLPTIDGFELARRLTAEDPAAPVIFITAHPEETSARAEAAGASTLLHKPFAESELIEALRQAIGPGFDPYLTDQTGDSR